MIYALLYAGTAGLIVILIYRQELKKANALSRWTFLALIGLTVALYVFRYTWGLKVPRLAGLLIQWLDPFDPIQ